MSIVKPLIRLGFRELKGNDMSMVIDLYNSLSNESIYYRFRGFFKDFERYVKSVFSDPRNIVYGAFIGNELVGVLEAVYLSDGCYEMAIVVRDDYQGKGIGTRLVAYAINDLKRRGAKTLVAYSTPDNHRILAISRKFHGIIKCMYDECTTIFNLQSINVDQFLN
ncbi:GNAT family N-acetyltransferase [Vulcanisaeta distributa]|uniref:GCN5-related N-acetyltransferase n=1 Tax=Vulcanisaeta distributa (strain DSM 14429 / JCM 11212 / NBRC 100878 / IC-017) TaxID=572478 RepID=E1QV04_VULDI|nr:GNAT family N-acetyltransferase [Vulcanisaeta distributa]ADN51195.1 GCN5-related N-acetyltransferase [Vulcanisaeta distributa DSM 14429]